MIPSLYAKALTTGDISPHVAEAYGPSASKETVSRITDKVLEEMNEWQNQRLDDAYAAIFIDAIENQVPVRAISSTSPSAQSSASPMTVRRTT